MRTPRWYWPAVVIAFVMLVFADNWLLVISALVCLFCLIVAYIKLHF